MFPIQLAPGEMTEVKMTSFSVKLYSLPFVLCLIHQRLTRNSPVRQKEKHDSIIMQYSILTVNIIRQKIARLASCFHDRSARGYFWPRHGSRNMFTNLPPKCFPTFLLFLLRKLPTCPIYAVPMVTNRLWL